MYFAVIIEFSGNLEQLTISTDRAKIFSIFIRGFVFSKWLITFQAWPTLRQFKKNYVMNAKHE
ncbi:hypothetical protein Q764_13940 [Flavobacterium suncheonense GH29-5 = DSM 17707]|uniref:Uncharacterized protein n=1 Tax=Flavobacterium suncheonense GH29-5 = DSM 17707 TaxID=1121899 RepID=A0A0A2LZG4_9FLAO|nr:hypothetical protein Q764_13940 [Flavobacterium suncheonense GH29-5 = DSM 17707]